MFISYHMHIRAEHKKQENTSQAQHSTIEF